MGYEITTDAEHGIVEIRFFQATGHTQHVNARNEILQICRDRNIRKILIDPAIWPWTVKHR